MSIFSVVVGNIAAIVALEKMPLKNSQRCIVSIGMVLLTVPLIMWENLERTTYHQVTVGTTLFWTLRNEVFGFNLAYVAFFCVIFLLLHRYHDSDLGGKSVLLRVSGVSLAAGGVIGLPLMNYVSSTPSGGGDLQGIAVIVYPPLFIITGTVTSAILTMIVRHRSSLTLAAGVLPAHAYLYASFVGNEFNAWLNLPSGLMLGTAVSLGVARLNRKPSGP